jgi:hypothetical protein
MSQAAMRDDKKSDHVSRASSFLLLRRQPFTHAATRGRWQVFAACARSFWPNFKPLV